MMQTRRNRATGLDIGQTTAKVVCLSRSGRKAVVTRAEIFRFRDEGILGDAEQETFQAIGSWLKELKLLNQRVVLGLPQYMATTQVNDFVKGVKGPELERMVSYETTQLAGISDDAFLHDYAILPAGNGRANPVLIGICREANVDDFTGKAAEVAIAMEDVAMDGLAMVNAFVQLHPDEARGAGVQLLMDIGTETTTVAVVCAGQALYIGSMMFGGVNVTQEIAHQLQLTADEAERRKLAGEVDWAELNLAAMSLDTAAAGLGWGAAGEPDLSAHDTHDVRDDDEGDDGDAGGDGLPPLRLSLSDLDPSEAGTEGGDGQPPLRLKLPGLSSPEQDGEEGEAFAEETAEDSDDGAAAGESAADPAAELGGLGCFRTMVRELSGSLEHWRSSESEELSGRSLARIWICGGGSSVEMVQTYLSMSQNCEVSVLGPTLPGGDGPAPEYTIAYGLALQGLGLAAVPISLAPRALAWMLRKESRAKFVVLAFLLLFGCLFGWLYAEHEGNRRAVEELGERTAELKANVTKLTKLDGMKREYQACLMQVLPIVSGHSRTQAYLSSLAELQQAVKSPQLKECTNWCVYVADEDSFTEYNESKEARPAAPAAPLTMQPRRRGQPRLLETTETAQDEQQQTWQATLAAEEKATDVIAVAPLRRLYVVGMIVSNHDNHNVIEQEIMLQLKGKAQDGQAAGGLFGEVQVMNEEERKRCSERALMQWEKVFNHIATNDVFRNYRSGYKPFYLRLGYREPKVTPPAENPLGDGSAKRKKGGKRK